MRGLRAITRFAEGVNEVVGHPIAFLLALIQTSLWTVMLVVRPNIDPHGFWFLYAATAVSYVTQFTLTLVGLSAKKESKRAAEESRRALGGVLEMMKVTHELVLATRAMVDQVREQFKETEEDIDEQLDEIQDWLLDQRPR